MATTNKTLVGRRVGVLSLVIMAAIASNTLAHASPMQSASALSPEDQVLDRAIAAHMAFLADDLLEGRGTCAAGYDIAARYVAAQFQQFGLHPGGESNTWLQAVPLLESKLVSDTAHFELRSPSEPTFWTTTWTIWPGPTHSKPRGHSGAHEGMKFMG